MTATAHALTAGIIASTVSNQPIGLGLSFVSHPILDMIPHWDLGWGWREKSKIRLFVECIADLFVGVALTYFFFSQGVDLKYLLGCLALSLCWDVLEAPYWFMKWKFPPFSTIYQIQSPIQGKAKLPLGVLTQVATVVILALVLNLLAGKI